MTAVDDTPQERDEKAADLERKVRRFKIETRLLYFVAIGLAVYVAHLSSQIQASRVQSSTASCEQTNRRYLDALTQLDRFAIPPHPTAQQTAALQSTKLLIAALVPFTGDSASKTDPTGMKACRAAAEKRVKT